VAERSKEWVCGRSPTETVSSNPTGDMDICLLWVLCMLSGRDLWDGLITRPEESYRLWCVFVCDHVTSGMRRLQLARVVNARHKKSLYLHIRTVTRMWWILVRLVKIRFAVCFISPHFCVKTTALETLVFYNEVKTRGVMYVWRNIVVHSRIIVDGKSNKCVYVQVHVALLIQHSTGSPILWRRLWLLWLHDIFRYYLIIDA
jgi:hypothetical protein